MKYNQDFIFKEGIYVTMGDFKKNKPNLTPENFKRYNPDLDYIGGKSDIFYTTTKKLLYPDSLENIREVSIDSLFGYSTRKHLYVFQRNPNLISKRFEEVRVIHIGTIGFGLQVDAHNLPLNYQNMPIYGSFKDTNQLLLDYKNEKIYNGSIVNFEKLLIETDQDLYKEFSKLSNSKKKKQMISYLLKANKRNPIYFKN